MANYTLAESWGKSNIQGRVYYCQEASDLTALITDGKVLVGDCAYVITQKKVYILDFNDTWQEI